jgi:hypothetical protein
VVIVGQSQGVHETNKVKVRPKDRAIIVLVIKSFGDIDSINTRGLSGTRSRGTMASLGVFIRYGECRQSPFIHLVHVITSYNTIPKKSIVDTYVVHPSVPQPS